MLWPMKHGLAQQNRKARNESKKDINSNMQDIYVTGGKVKLKVKFTLELATKAQRDSGRSVIHFFQPQP